MNKLTHLLLGVALLGILACDDTTTNNDGSADTGTHDADQASDADPDVGDTNRDAQDDTQADISDEDSDGEGCLQVEASDAWDISYFDGASTEYWADTSPTIEGETRKLSVLFERYGDASYEGTFELGPGTRDENFGNCAHCVFIRSDSAERAYFADAGTLVSNVDPFTRKLDVQISGLRLIEVDVDGATRESTPIDDGDCIEVADFSVEGTFPPEAWTCLTQKYDDGEYCNCECGAVDPDCDTAPDCLPGMPGCDPSEFEELPVVGCEAEEVCQFEPVSGGTECVATCDWSAKTGCNETTTCVYDFGPYDSDLCLTGQQRIFPNVSLGESCPTTGLQGVCNVVDGFAEGYCGPNNLCRPLCNDDAECTESGETCRKFEDPAGLGYCGPIPTDG